MNISAANNSQSSTRSSGYFSEASDSEGEGEFGGELQQVDDSNAAVQAALAMSGNPQSQPQTKSAQAGGVSATELLGKPGAALAQQAKEATPRDKLVNAVRLQERQSASANTVDALTGLQPWDKNWVFKRGDAALSPGSAQAEADQKAGIEQLMQKLQASRKQMGGGDETASGSFPDAVAETNIQPPMSPEALAMMQALNGPETGAVSGMDAGMGMDGAATNREKRMLSGAKQVATKPGMQALSGEEFLGLKDSMQANKLASTTGVPGAMPRPDGALETPVGTWKPKKDAGKNGLLPGQENAFRAALDHSQASAARNLNTALSGTNGINPRPREVEGFVTQGSMAQNRLSTETLVGIGAQLRSMTQFGGGEMRIRLRPENLGELSVRVNTSGNQVSLEIRASDEKAKRIIEDSVGYLKESLASQNLTVTRLDLSVAPVSQQGNTQFDLAQQGQFQGGLNPGNDQGQQSGQGQLGKEGERPGRSEVGLSRGENRPVSRFGESGRNASTGRLDVMA